jgi:hypothetical protein
MNGAIFARQLEDSLFQFFREVEKDLNLPIDAIKNRWLDQKKDTTSKKSASTKKFKSNYQVFFSIQRNNIMKQYPNLSFGEVSKKVSIMWKTLSQEKKKMYTEDMEAKQKDLIMPIQDESIQIIHTNNKKKMAPRSKLELSVEDEKDKEDEEDFYFQDENENESHAEDFDDDDLVDDIEDDEIYDD